MIVRNDDEWSDGIEYDPRWEVQPESDRDDDPGSNAPAVLTATLVVTAVVGLLGWLVMNTPPSF